MNKKCFTLIELLIVIVIIGILAVMSMPQYQKIKARGESAEVLISLKAIANATMIYYMEYGSYFWIAYADVPAVKTGKFERIGLNNLDSEKWVYGLGSPYAGSGFWAPCAAKNIEPYYHRVIWYNTDTNELHTEETDPYPGIEAVSPGVK